MGGMFPEGELKAARYQPVGSWWADTTKDGTVIPQHEGTVPFCFCFPRSVGYPTNPLEGQGKLRLAPGVQMSSREIEEWHEH